MTRDPQRIQPSSMLSSFPLEINGVNSSPSFLSGQPSSMNLFTWESTGSFSVQSLMRSALTVVVDSWFITSTKSAGQQFSSDVVADDSMHRHC